MGNERNIFDLEKIDLYVDGIRLNTEKKKIFANKLNELIEDYRRRINRTNIAKKLFLNGKIKSLIFPLLKKIMGRKQEDAWKKTKEKIIAEEYSRYKNYVSLFIKSQGFKNKNHTIKIKNAKGIKNLINKVTLLAINGIPTEKATQDVIKALMYSNKDIGFKKIKLLSPLNVRSKYNGEYNWIKIPPMTYQGYNEFCVKELSKYVETDYVLLIQDDGFIVNPDAWIDEFLKYDYIGGPVITWSGGNSVGNGGFSLRSKKLLNLCARFKDYNAKKIVEDVFICTKKNKFFTKKGCSFAPLNIAGLFSRGEYNLCHPYFETFGFHGKEYIDLVKLKDRIKI